jgi:DNA replicative helicase MCM subunit Mcm2 (Cdc46/Mcm family)
MAEYCFYCEKCSYEFSRMISRSEIINYKTKCPMCDSEKVYRDYKAENVGVDDGVPKTVGMLADKNSERKKIR